MRNLNRRLDLCSINTATLGHREPIGRVIDRVAAAGFGGIAPWRRDLEGEDVNAIARQILALGLTVTGYCRSTFIPAATREQFERNIADNKAALADAATLGARCFVMVVGGVPEGSRDLAGAREQVAEGVHALLDTARELRVPLALEPLHPMYAANRSVLNTVAQALAMCETLDPDRSGWLGIAVDAYHCWWDPSLHDSIARAGKAGRILAYHVCDWLHDTQDMLLDRGMMGDGIVDLGSLRQSIEQAGYDGLVEVEIFSREHWWRRDADEVLATCAQRLQTIC